MVRRTAMGLLRLFSRVPFPLVAHANEVAINLRLLHNGANHLCQ